MRGGDMTETCVDRWSLPLDRAVCLSGAPGDAIAVALEDLSEEGPALIRVRAEPSDRKSAIIDGVLAALTRVAVELFPAWLPGAATVNGHSSLDFAAVRIHARRLAATSSHYGPFLFDLAQRALSEVAVTTRRQFAEAEVAEGLARVLGASWRRNRVALVIGTDELTPPRQHALASASEWLAARGFAVWLVDDPIPAVDRISTVYVTLPEYLREIRAAESPNLRESTVEYRAVAGKPHPGSEVEKRVDRELAKHAWAASRRLNHPFQHSVIAQRYLLDIVWLDDRFVVELDGEEHFSPWRRAKDSQRDEILRGLGFHVLRIPNERVLTNVWQVVDEIEAALRQHRLTRNFPVNTLLAVEEGRHP